MIRSHLLRGTHGPRRGKWVFIARELTATQFGRSLVFPVALVEREAFSLEVRREVTPPAERFARETDIANNWCFGGTLHRPTWLHAREEVRIVLRVPFLEEGSREEVSRYGAQVRAV